MDYILLHHITSSEGYYFFRGSSGYNHIYFENLVKNLNMTVDVEKDYSFIRHAYTEACKLDSNVTVPNAISLEKILTMSNEFLLFFLSHFLSHFDDYRNVDYSSYLPNVMLRSAIPLCKFLRFTLSQLN